MGISAPNFLTALYAYLSGTTMDHLDEFWAYMIDEAAGAFESGRSMEDLRYYSLTSEEVARFPMWFTWGPRVPLETAFPMKRGRVDVTADLAHTSDWHFGLWVYLWLTSSLLITEHVVELQNVGHRVIHIRAIEFIYSFFLFFSLWQAFLSLITMLTMQIPFPAASEIWNRETQMSQWCSSSHFWPGCKTSCSYSSSVVSWRTGTS